MDALACNFDCTANVPDSCTYFDAAYGNTTEFVLGTVELESGCNGGYAVAESLPVSLVESMGGMTWEFDSATAQILIDNGFGIVVDDLTTQSLSLCANDMNVMDAAGNNYTLSYDGSGYINQFYFGYLAPTSNFEYGCGFEFACNYDPCSLYDFDLCEFLSISVETTSDNGTGSGAANASASGGTEPYSYAWYEGENEDSFADGMSVDGLSAGDYSVLAVDSTGCIGTLDFVIDAVDGVEAEDAMWNVFPNPTNGVIQVRVTTLGEGNLLLMDVNGKTLMSQQILATTTTMDLSSLPAGMYMLQLQNDQGVRTQHIQVIR
jgi:hypothetical protein